MTKVASLCTFVTWLTLSDDLPKGFKQNGRDFILLIINFKIKSLGTLHYYFLSELNIELNIYHDIVDAETLNISQSFQFVNQFHEIASVLFEAFWQMPYK